MTAPEPAAPPGEPARAPLTRVRTWIIGLVVVGVGAAITQAVTGGITSAGSSLWDRIAGEPAPLTVDASVASNDGTAFHFARPAAELGAVPSPDLGSAARTEWARAQGGANASSTVVEVVVQGKSSTAVVLTGLEVQVRDRRPPPGGTVVRPRGGEAVTVRHFTIDLDPSPAAVSSQPSDVPTGGPDAAIDFPYRVSASEPEVFLLLARTATCDCDWTAELGWTAGGRRGVTTIDDDGMPFRTVSTAAAVDYVEEEGALVRAE